MHFSLQKKLHSTEGEMRLEVDCHIQQGEFISLYGPSGVGKTSILRMLAGLMTPDAGTIKMENEIWFDKEKRIDMRPQQREIGFVFQDYALFPNMTVRQNIAFPLVKGASQNIVDELLQLTGLSLMGDRKIQTLSGGQQQRVALARAIAKKPKLLLLDEPLSAIDNALREQLQETLSALHKRYHLTTILVSHNLNEIVRLSDRVMHLSSAGLQSYETSMAFLQGIGHVNGLVGDVLSVDANNTGNKIVLFVRNSILETSIISNDTVIQKGQTIQLSFDDKTNLRLIQTKISPKEI